MDTRYAKYPVTGVNNVLLLLLLLFHGTDFLASQ
jgi:hypothetical protein